MQAGAITITGSNQNFVAPCAAGAFRLYSSGSFTFQFVVRKDELAANQNQVAIGQGVGVAVTAEERSSTDFFIEVHAPFLLPFNNQEVIGIVNATATVYVRPIRVGRD
jgi:hypothetical protein